MSDWATATLPRRVEEAFGQFIDMSGIGRLVKALHSGALRKLFETQSAGYKRMLIWSTSA